MTTNTTNTQNTPIEITQSYNDVKELFDAGLQGAKPDDRSEAAAVLIFGAVNDFTPTTVSILENLTGVELNTREHLYDYLKNALTLDDEFLVRTAGLQLMEALSRESQDPESSIEALIKDALAQAGDAA